MVGRPKSFTTPTRCCFKCAIIPPNVILDQSVAVAQIGLWIIVQYHSASQEQQGICGLLLFSLTISIVVKPLRNRLSATDNATHLTTKDDRNVLDQDAGLFGKVHVELRINDSSVILGGFHRQRPSLFLPLNWHKLRLCNLYHSFRRSVYTEAVHSVDTEWFLRLRRSTRYLMLKHMCAVSVEMCHLNSGDIV